MIEKIIARVGGSIGWAGRPASTARSQRVSATVAVPKPARATMSPASAASIPCRPRPRKPRTLVIRACSTVLPSGDRALAVMFGRTVPEKIRPVRTRPR